MRVQAEARAGRPGARRARAGAVWRGAYCVAADALLEGGGARVKDGIRIEVVAALRAHLGERLGEDVEQQLRVRVGVHVPAHRLDGVLERRRVGQVAIVCDAQAVREVGVERLRLGAGGGARSRIAAVSNAHWPAQLDHRLLREDVLDKAVVLAEVEPLLLARHHARSVLPTVLEDGERVEDHLVHVLILVGKDHADNAAAARQPADGMQGRARAHTIVGKRAFLIVELLAGKDEALWLAKTLMHEAIQSAHIRRRLHAQREGAVAAHEDLHRAVDGLGAFLSSHATKTRREIRAVVNTERKRCPGPESWGSLGGETQTGALTRPPTRH